MQTIPLIACGKSKLPDAAPARELYTGTLFRKSVAYAESQSVDRIFVLSGKLGLVPIDAVVEPYELKLHTLPIAERKRWAGRVVDELRRYADLQADRFLILAGPRYREHLLPPLAPTKVPLRGMSQGHQLRWLTGRPVVEKSDAKQPTTQAATHPNCCTRTPTRTWTYGIWISRRGPHVKSTGTASRRD